MQAGTLEGVLCRHCRATAHEADVLYVQVGLAS